MSKAKALGGNKSECIKVAIRCRPISKREIAENRECVVKMIASKGEVIIQKQSEEVPKIFTFDCVYDATAN